MKNIPSIPKRCKLLLKDWRINLSLTAREKDHFKDQLKILDKNIQRLQNKHFQVAVFGRVGVGKSSLLNALVKKSYFRTDVANGCTFQPKSYWWEKSFDKIKRIELIDTPGIDEIGGLKKSKLAYEIALEADLIVFVLDSDLTDIEQSALKSLLGKGKQVLLFLNRTDQWNAAEIQELKESIKRRLPLTARELDIQTVSAAPRQPKLYSNGKVRSEKRLPEIDKLQESLIKLIKKDGELLLALNALQQADFFYECLKEGRLRRNKVAAQSVIGKFAAVKASGVAINPLLMIDLATGIACDTALIIQLSKIYGLGLGGQAARQMMKRLSLYNSLLGGAQLGIQLALATFQHLLLIAAPLTGGLSLVSTGPIAIAQAALAIHTTKLTGRLAANEFLHGKNLNQSQPGLLLKRLANKNPQAKRLLENASIKNHSYTKHLQALLP